MRPPFLYPPNGKVHLGGKMMYEMTFSEESLESLRSSATDIKAGVEASFSGWGASAHASASYGKIAL
jgi:hypothetical protein